MNSDKETAECHAFYLRIQILIIIVLSVHLLKCIGSYPFMNSYNTLSTSISLRFLIISDATMLHLSPSPLKSAVVEKPENPICLTNRDKKHKIKMDRWLRCIPRCNILLARFTQSTST